MGGPELGSTPILRAENLAIGYRGTGRLQKGVGRGTPGTPVLDGINLELHAGELVCLLGPNGAGKSTLLRTLGGLQEPLAGRLTVDGGDFASLSPAARARKAAIVLTDRAEAGNLSVYALAALGRHPHTGWGGLLRDADRAAVRKGLEEAGAWELRDRLFDELSDGEKQRVMLARALAQEPSLLLLDEPTAFLDLPRRVETMRVLRRLARERNRAVLLSTHDLDLAMRAADRLWLISPGGPVRTGAPEDLALGGWIGSAFDQGDVAFDAATGQFRVHGHAKRTARISGDPVLAFWAGRALEREGFAPMEARGSPVSAADTTADKAADLTVSASYREGKPAWECLGAVRGVFTSLESLTSALRR